MSSRGSIGPRLRDDELAIFSKTIFCGFEFDFLTFWTDSILLGLDVLEGTEERLRLETVNRW